MIRIRQVKVALGCEDKLCDIVAKKLKLSASDILEFYIQKKSLDARKKNDIHYVYEVDVKVKEEGRILRKASSKDIFLAPKEEYQYPHPGSVNLAYRPVVVGTGPARPFIRIISYFVPSHNILEFSRIIDEEDSDIELHIFNNKILFRTGNLKFESRLINGTYPNTSNLLPDSSYLVVSTNLNAFYNVIDRVSILTSDKEKNIVTLETRGDMLVLKSSSVEIGRVEEKMPITKNNDEDIKISFSAKYMMEALKSFSTETVDIHFVGEIKPILIKSSEDETLTQLVLPIRTY